MNDDLFGDGGHQKIRDILLGALAEKPQWSIRSLMLTLARTIAQHRLPHVDVGKALGLHECYVSRALSGVPKYQRWFAAGLGLRIQTPSGYRHQWSYRDCPTRRVGDGLSLKYGGGWVAEWSVTSATVNALVARGLAKFRGAAEIELDCLLYDAKSGQTP
jgi:hypothetical protein